MSTYPFTAILGQSAMQTALLLCAVDPGLGGVLLRGQKGTAKSTAARALADLLPPVAVVSGCPFHCDPAQRDDPAPCCHNRQAAGETLYSELIPTPFVDLPLSATEDRLVGALNLEKTLQTGLRQFEPGLLATAHRGILYVDEVNLLPDHLVDLLLDVAASGVNRVEREGLRYSHAARFLLVGTMNPEEGELRPQFLDRFGLCVTISGLSDRQLRYDVVMQSLAFDRDPDAFLADFQDLETIAREQVVRARQQLQEVDLPVAVIERAVDLARRMAEALGKPGLRERALHLGIRLLAARWRWRVWWFGDAIQPKTLVTRYPAGRGARAAARQASSPLPELRAAHEARRLPQAAAVGGR